MDAREFSRRLSALAQDIIDAHIHYKLWRDLQKQHKANPLVMAQSPTFWRLTLKAHLTTSLYHLARVFVPERNAMSIGMLLSVIRENDKVFSRKATALAGSPLAECLAKNGKVLDPSSLTEDIAVCAGGDVLVRKLIDARAKGFAKVGTKAGLGIRRDAEAAILSFREMEILLMRALLVFRRYSDLFEATSQSGKVIANDDFKRLFEAADAMAEARLA